MTAEFAERDRRMALLVVRNTSLASRILRYLASGVPRPLHQFWRGPRTTITLGGVNRPNLPWLRRVDLAIPASMVLERKMTIPAVARKELRSAIELMIRQDTPFAPSELLAVAVEAPRPDAVDQFRVVVRLVPRSTIAKHLEPLRLRRTRIDRVKMADGTNVSTLLHPVRRLTRWAWLIPLAVVAISVVTIAARDLGAWQDEIAALGDMVAEAAVATRNLSLEVEAAQSKLAGRKIVVAALNASLPAFSMLEQLRSALSAEAEVLGISVRPGTLAVSLRSRDILAELRRLEAAHPDWAVSTEGAILAHPLGGETATAVISWPTAAGTS